MIIRNKNKKQGVSPIALLAAGGGVAAFIFWLVQRSNSGSDSDRVIATSITETQTIQLPKGATNAVPFGDIILYDYSMHEDTSTDKIEVKNDALLRENDLIFLSYDAILPKLGLASDAITSSAVAMKGFLVPNAQKLSKKGNLELIAKCQSNQLLSGLKTQKDKTNLALIIDKVTKLANTYLASDSNSSSKKKLSDLDRQRLAAAIMWSFIQSAEIGDLLMDIWQRMMLDDSRASIDSKEIPSSLAIGYVEAFLRGYFNCENAGYPEFLVIPAAGSIQLPYAAIPSKYSDFGSNSSKEPAYFNGVVFYAKKIL
jgi:hypothetical protein